MEENKIIKLDIKPSEVEQKTPRRTVSNSLSQTNPILQRKLFANLINKKNKFNFKDLFR